MTDEQDRRYEQALMQIAANPDYTRGEMIAASMQALCEIYPDDPTDGGNSAEWQGLARRVDPYCSHCGRSTEGVTCQTGPSGVLCMRIGENLPTCFDLVTKLGEPPGCRKRDHP